MELSAQFEANREHLRGVAFRMLGSLSEAEDAVQEAWLHASRAGTDGVENVGGWLTTIVARVSLDMLRSRSSRREDAAPPPDLPADGDPEREAALADSVGLALMVVLDTLAPAERLAFVLHDLFGMDFEEIAKVIGKSADATRQLASRARRRIQGRPSVDAGELAVQREVVGHFLSALRRADFDALVAVLDPDVVVRAEGGKRIIHGAQNWAKGALAYQRLHASSRPALVDGAVGLVLAPRGKLLRALKLGFANGKIVRVDIVADAAELDALEIALLDDGTAPVPISAARPT